jgi:hypothetical protein
MSAGRIMIHVSSPVQYLCIVLSGVQRVRVHFLPATMLSPFMALTMDDMSHRLYIVPSLEAPGSSSGRPYGQ